MGSEGYTYLDMPSSLYEGLFKDYPGDFRLINQQMLNDFIAAKKPSVLETPVDEIRSLPYAPAVIWEIEYLVRKGYKIVRGGGPELKINPSLPMDSPYIIEQIIVEVTP